MKSAALQQKGGSSAEVAKPTAKQEQKLQIKNDAQVHSFSGFPLQTKLTIGSPNDKYEREADAMADRIMRMPMNSASGKPLSSNGPAIQAKCSACNHEEEKIQRKPLMMKSEGGTSVATQALGAQLNSTKGSGSPLPSDTNSFMSSAFGSDFSNVRVHTDSKAQQMNQGLNARAFTHGSDIYFNRGQYQPGASEGKRLLGHELTHVVQQNTTAHDSTNLANLSTQFEGIQREKLPCTSEKTIDMFVVNLPGATRSINDDLPTINAILCQCGITINVTGGMSIASNILDLTPPNGVLNTGSTVTTELQALMRIRPGGNVIHAYYVPALSSGALAEGIGAARFTPALPDSVLISNQAGSVSIIAAHELGHVLLNNGSHHANADNLMAAGNVNSGVGELTQSQCNRMP